MTGLMSRRTFTEKFVAAIFFSLVAGSRQFNQKLDQRTPSRLDSSPVSELTIYVRTNDKKRLALPRSQRNAMCNGGRNRERTCENFLKRARHGKINRKFRRIETIMKKMTLVATLFVIATLIAPAAFAQSSGSFNFASLPLQC